MQMTQSSDRVRILHQSSDLLARCAAVRWRAATTRWEARTLREVWGDRRRSSPFVRGCTLRGGSGTTDPGNTTLGHWACRICHQPFMADQALVDLQSDPAHLDCMYPTALAKTENAGCDQGRERAVHSPGGSSTATAVPG